MTFLYRITARVSWFLLGSIWRHQTLFPISNIPNYIIYRHDVFVSQHVWKTFPRMKYPWLSHAYHRVTWFHVQSMITHVMTKLNVSKSSYQHLCFTLISCMTQFILWYHDHQINVAMTTGHVPETCESLGVRWFSMCAESSGTLTSYNIMLYVYFMQVRYPYSCNRYTEACNTNKSHGY